MTDDKECKSCAILRRYEKTARERGYAMGKAAGNNELAQAQELLAFERKAHAETNAALTAEITRLEAQLAAAAPGAVPDDPMDWPIPCDLSVGGATIKKGCKFRTVKTRMEVLHRMAMEKQFSIAAPDCSHTRTLITRKDDGTLCGVCKECGKTSPQGSPLLR